MEDLFDKELGKSGLEFIHKLIKELELCIELYNQHVSMTGHGRGGGLSNLGVFGSFMDRYKKFGLNADDTDFEDHAWLFIEAYKMNRDTILSYLDKGTEFLKSKDFMISLGKGDPVLEKEYNARIMIPGIYDKAMILRGFYEKKPGREEKAQYLLAPAIRYYVICIIHTSITYLRLGEFDDDLDILSSMMEIFQVDAHLTAEQEETETKTGIAAMAGSMMRMGSTFLKDQNGKPIDRGDADKMTNFVSDLFSDPETMNSMTRAASDNTEGSYGSRIVNVFSALRPKIEQFADNNRPPAPPGIDNSKAVAREKRHINQMFNNIEEGIGTIAKSVAVDNDSSSEEAV